jgi:3-oxoacyl-[acyl-carrier protein] reductase
MDLGIAGRKAVVCASSRGLGLACAKALAQAGCDVVINGRDQARLTAVAAELKKAANGATITPVAGDIATSDGQAALLAACPEPDILVNNNGGPPFRDFRELDRQKMLDGVIANMVVAIELIQKVISAQTSKRPQRRKTSATMRPSPNVSPPYRQNASASPMSLARCVRFFARHTRAISPARTS